MSLLAALDRFVHVTRLDILSPYAGRRPRSLRWWPLVPFAALAAGFALQVGALHGGLPWRTGVAGAFLFFAGFAAAQIMSLFGPRLFPDGAGELDERELTIQARAGSIAGTILTMLAALGCFYGGYAATFDAWLPATALEWVFLGLGILAAGRLLPVLVASWLLPRPEEEE